MLPAGWQAADLSQDFSLAHSASSSFSSLPDRRCTVKVEGGKTIYLIKGLLDLNKAKDSLTRKGGALPKLDIKEKSGREKNLWYNGVN